MDVQLMAPLIPLLEEAAEWVKDGNAGPARATVFVSVPVSWEWLTIAVFTCAKGCAAGEQTCGIVEETVVIANE